VDSPTGTAAVIQNCSRCGAALDVTGAASGAWLACPGCGRPVAVKPRPVVRPAPPPEPAPESTAWAPDPRFGPAPPVIPLDEPQPTPRRRVRKTGWMPFLVLAVFSGAANVTFVGTFLEPHGSFELALTWGFGFTLALFITALTRSILGRNLERVE
jgi:DNA-directed RNA polymerase subunit RPC12/RpoP